MSPALRCELGLYAGLAQRVLWLLLAMTLCRGVFVALNADQLAPDAPGLARAFAAGLRFDLCAVAYAMAGLLPLLWWRRAARSPRMRRGVAILEAGLAVALSGALLALELIDAAYFRYSLRRIGIADGALAVGERAQLFERVLEHWPLLLLWLVLVAGLAWREWRRLRSPGAPEAGAPAAAFALALVATALVVIAARGGLQLRPLLPVSAAELVGSVALAPAGTNAAMSLVHSLQQERISELSRFGDAELDARFSLLRHFAGASVPTRPLNVIVIALESFGRGAVGRGDTPVFDALEAEGLSFELAFANGLRSTQGMAALAAGVPALLHQPWHLSSYGGQRIDAPAALLRERGYATRFFHGGNAGTMGFEALAAVTGFERYVDREAFEDEVVDGQHYDGTWGVYDRPFLHFVAREIDALDAPFFALVLTLSSHHPYRVEAGFEARTPGLTPQQRSLRYADAALGDFFARARESDWYADTLFVLTADHIGASDEPQLGAQAYAVPLVFLRGDGSLRGRSQQLAQQVDVAPSLLHLTGHAEAFYAFGTSLFDRGAERAGSGVPTYESGVFTWITPRWVLRHDGAQALSLTERANDPRLARDLRAQHPEVVAALQDDLLAVVQRHHRALLRSELSIESRLGGR